MGSKEAIQKWLEYVRPEYADSSDWSIGYKIETRRRETTENSDCSVKVDTEDQEEELLQGSSNNKGSHIDMGTTREEENEEDVGHQSKSLDTDEHTVYDNEVEQDVSNIHANGERPYRRVPCGREKTCNDVQVGKPSGSLLNERSLLGDSVIERDERTTDRGEDQERRGGHACEEDVDNGDGYEQQGLVDKAGEKSGQHNDAVKEECTDDKRAGQKAPGDKSPCRNNLGVCEDQRRGDFCTEVVVHREWYTSSVEQQRVNDSSIPERRNFYDIVGVHVPYIDEDEDDDDDDDGDELVNHGHYRHGARPQLCYDGADRQGFYVGLVGGGRPGFVHHTKEEEEEIHVSEEERRDSNEDIGERDEDEQDGEIRQEGPDEEESRVSLLNPTPENIAQCSVRTDDSHSRSSGEEHGCRCPGLNIPSCTRVVMFGNSCCSMEADSNSRSHLMYGTFTKCGQPKEDLDLDEKHPQIPSSVHADIDAGSSTSPPSVVVGGRWRPEHDVLPDVACSAPETHPECASLEAQQFHRSSLEPPWAGSVGQKGDVFYVEPGSTGSSSGPPPGGTDENHRPPLPTVHNGLNNGRPPRETAPSSAASSRQQGDPATPAKTKKGLRRKVKEIITPKGKQNNNDVDLQNGRSRGDSHTVRNNVRNQQQHQQSQPLQRHPNNSPLTVTFNDAPTGLTKDVRLFVDPHRHNYGRRATLCETLFGIVPGYFGPRAAGSGGSGGRPSPPNGTVQDRRIMVQGLLPGGEALRSGLVKIGDWLMCVNDLEVNFDNFDSILSAITTPKEVKLTLQKLAIQPAATPRPGVVRKSPVVNEALVRLVSGERATRQPSPSLSGLPHCVLFLTLVSSEDGAPKDDVLYQFPEEESKLVEIRGMFLTLSHMLHDVTENAARSSAMVIDNKPVHVAYAREGQQVLVIALPADRIMLVQVNQIVEDVVRLLRVLYGSLKSAFSCKENHGRLHHFFSLLYQRTLLKEEMVSEGLQTAIQDEPLLDVLSGVRSLHLPAETKIIINNALSDLEAADFADMSEDFYDLRRAYTVLGGALFYKGYHVASHLHREDLADACLYLRHHALLTLCHEEQMGQLVVWKEVFPWRRCHVQTDPLLPGYTEPEARWFLLVVGMKNTMLAMLLEAGGCATWAEGHPGPDPFYVDQAKASLLQLEALDIPNQCEIRLSSPSIPSLASVDWFFPSTKGLKDDVAVPPQLVKVQNSPKAGLSPSKKLMQPESILKKRPGMAGSGGTPSPQADRVRPPARPGAVYDVESDADSHSTGNSDSSTPIMDRRGRKPSAGSDESFGSGSSSGLFKGQKKKRTLLSAYDVTGLKTSLRDATAEEDSFVKLTSGCDNTLFHYVHLDPADGILLCPTQQELAGLATSTHSQLLTNFHQACLTIRSIFQDTAKKQHLLAVGTAGQFGSGAALGAVREHGILFHCSPTGWTDVKRAPPVVSYWVVGRQMSGPYRREFYVCFQDSAQQNLVELAFKLGFGILV